MIREFIHARPAKSGRPRGLMAAWRVLFLLCLVLAALPARAESLKGEGETTAAARQSQEEPAKEKKRFPGRSVRTISHAISAPKVIEIALVQMAMMSELRSGIQNKFLETSLLNSLFQ